MRTWFLLLVSVLPCAAEKWIEIQSGPFLVLSDAGDKAAREQMNQLEQFRYTLGSALGKSEMTLVWPLKVVVSKRAQASSITLSRDAYITAAPVDLHELARLFIEQNTRRLPDIIEHGLEDVFSTIQINGTIVTLGAPPPPAARNRNWARMQLLSTDPAYAGRTQVLINNLENGGDFDVAYRNAYEKTKSALEKQVDTYLSVGSFGTTRLSAKALNPMRDFHPTTADPGENELALADLHPSESAYKALHGPEAAEGLGFLALAAGKKDEASGLFRSAVQSGSKSARVYLETGDYPKAVALNPRWAEPLYRQALASKDLDHKTILLKKATALEPRNVQYWEALARNETEAARFVDAQKAWGGAERAAASPEERQRIHDLRLSLEANRADHEAEERRKRAEEEAKDLERVKNASMAAIHEAEAASRNKLNPNGAPVPKATEWWDGPEAAGRAEGTLERFDCIGRQAKLLIRGADGKTTLLLVRDPSQIVLTGAGNEATLACGPQKSTRKVVVQYNPKPDRKLGTAGEAVSIEFR